MLFRRSRNVTIAHGQSEPDPIEMLIASGEPIREAPSLSVVVDVSFDALQANGQKLEFAETRQIFARRPDRLRIDVTRREDDSARAPNQ